ncbi:hypothetical protein POVCU2_0039940 [Plasmodium ovale curtisi]|uniref:Uncharacterized protein n=1 Tax=Plasmodium ovale curtisi TaxID=864141 RepID=A0A1A8W5F8_PLAOA|nr:hypothetical protein POVCU2_0039940 [Plasmodium ovale curtisi]SBS88067.1 hypothetical protein POVCU1_015480 [Plasmodium ovale curtisi]
MKSSTQGGAVLKEEGAIHGYFTDQYFEIIGQKYKFTGKNGEKILLFIQNLQQKEFPSKYVTNLKLKLNLSKTKAKANAKEEKKSEEKRGKRTHA